MPERTLSDFTSQEESNVFSEGSEVRTIIKRCHNTLYKDEGLDPARAFDELTLSLIHISDGDVYKRQEHAIEQDSYAEVLSVNGNDSNGYDTLFQLDSATVDKLVAILEDYSFTDTYAGSDSPDIKGEMFQEMVGETFRAELGAYFTPREIVRFIVDFLGVEKDDRLLDPSCGSGGFFVGALDHLSDKVDSSEQITNYVEENVWGLDINNRMARTSRFNLFTYSNSTGNIHLSDALRPPEPEFAEESFDLILSNPPFAGQEDRDGVLQEYDIGRKDDGSVRSVSKELPFIEKIINWLDEGGKAGIVLPESVFNNQSQQFEDIRQFLYENVKIIALIGLPPEAFYHTDTGVQGALLFIEKTPVDNDYEIYFDWAEHVGYDSLGHKIGRNDLPDIVERYHNDNATKEHYYSLSTLREKGRIDPTYYHPERVRLQERAEGSEDNSVPLSDIVKEDNTTVSKRVKSQDGNHFAYVQVGSCSKAGEIEKWRDIVIGKDSVPSRLKYWLEPGTIMLPNHRDSLKADRDPVLVPDSFEASVTESGTLRIFDDEIETVSIKALDSESGDWVKPEEALENVDFPVKVEYDIEANDISNAKEADLRMEGQFRGFVVTNRFIQLKARDSFASSESPVTQFANHVLQRSFVREQLIRETTGAASPELKAKNLDDISIPVPEDGDISRFMSDILEKEQRIQRNKEEIQKLESEIETEFEGLIPESR
ncbi:N-6 DNA methylase [Haloarcula argentinensis]|uniref:N-6 DNA methylase n=1 Tax=Haloarcula argentinensis TaxID=43776 RepID=UPI0002B0F919|nr:N-6 DNA methylase [Haloarcula argentinensis]EMA19929.1 N-6 DNA methylase [Haloarcula argentinensis DSM 12282]